MRNSLSYGCPNRTGFHPIRPLSTPVLFLIFNRPYQTARVFEVIREAKPPILYVAADGPRENFAADVESTLQARRVATQVDWDCEVRTLFRESNLGCRESVSAAISWFFQQEEFGIVLEDDCLPDLSFFWFCEDMLLEYRHDDRVWHVGGTNPLARFGGVDNRYHFSLYNRIWGWASWSRAWTSFDPELASWPSIRDSGILPSLLGKVQAKRYKRIFDEVYNGRIDTWDYQWFLARLMGGIAIMPAVNLVSNIGFGQDGTHTRDAAHHLSNLPRGSYRQPADHPRVVAVNRMLDTLWSLQELVSMAVAIARRIFVKFLRAL